MYFSYVQILLHLSISVRFMCVLEECEDFFLFVFKSLYSVVLKCFSSVVAASVHAALLWPEIIWVLFLMYGSIRASQTTKDN